MDTLHEGLQTFMTVDVIIIEVIADAEGAVCTINRLFFL
jgi:hypothetical protein